MIINHNKKALKGRYLLVMGEAHRKKENISKSPGGAAHSRFSFSLRMLSIIQTININPFQPSASSSQFAAYSLSLRQNEKIQVA